MCGIAGFSNFEDNFLSSGQKQENYFDLLRKMRLSIKHRGNDQSGEYLKENVGLAHTRLSIRDISNGAQPMVRGVYAIVYNGEIYNTDELTKDLTQAGYSFKTTCDTEAILYSYMHYGLDCVNHLNGIFAFAIWDNVQKKLILVRDHMGVKPLFYAKRADTFVFASELKALFCHPLVTPQADINSFREIFGIGPARTPGNGVFKDVEELMAGHLAVVDKGGIEIKKYWDMTADTHTDSYEQTVDKVSYLVRDAITRQLVSDVPVCSFLSGGIDSSIVTAVAAQHLKSQGSTFNTFSFDFKGNDKYFNSNAFQPQQDRPFVDIMLSHIDVNHTYLECDELSLADLLYDAVVAKDLPGMTDIDASLLYFCSLVKQNNKVALTGECADEIFGGYPWFYRDDLMWGDSFPWSKNTAVRECLLQDDLVKKINLEDYSRQKYMDTIKDVPCLPGEDKMQKRHREITYLNIKWFMQTLLDRMDRTSMFSALEARVPFADYRIVEYVYNVPWEYKRRNGVEKSLLRDAFKDALPYELLHRKKSPYPKTYNPNFEALLKQRLKAVVSSSNSPVCSIVDTKKVLEFIENSQRLTTPWFGQLMTAPQLMAYILQINYWLERYNPTIII